MAGDSNKGVPDGRCGDVEAMWKLVASLFYALPGRHVAQTG